MRQLLAFALRPKNLRPKRRHRPRHPRRPVGAGQTPRPAQRRLPRLLARPQCQLMRPLPSRSVTHHRLMRRPILRQRQPLNLWPRLPQRLCVRVSAAQHPQRQRLVSQAPRRVRRQLSPSPVALVRAMPKQRPRPAHPRGHGRVPAQPLPLPRKRKPNQERLQAERRQKRKPRLPQTVAAHVVQPQNPLRPRHLLASLNPRPRQKRRIPKRLALPRAGTEAVLKPRLSPKRSRQVRRHPIVAPRQRQKLPQARSPRRLLSLVPTSRTGSCRRRRKKIRHAVSQVRESRRAASTFRAA